MQFEVCMNHRNQLSDTWLKASVLGATWAASEIILGSFLHNLRIPFNGNILTAIGLILMISASYKWKDKGLFWRTGLICALMKTMSPSAVIFGPMIAIFAEAVLLDFSVRVFGRNIVGFIVGASLAMSWILVQKIVNFILFYGMNIIEVYTEMMNFAAKQLKIQMDLVWLPILVLLGIYLLFGIIAVIIGMKIGKNLLIENNEIQTEQKNAHSNFLTNQNTNNFPFSLVWLFLNFIVLIAMLFLINGSPIYIWTTLTVLVLLVWTQRYKRGLKQLSKPKFWIFFILITMITAFVVTSSQEKNGGWMQGLIVGLQMNFRAAIVIVGFSVLGTELYNPKIRNYFAKTAFKQLPIALELAFESLPLIISNLPDLKQVFKNPISVIKSLILQNEKRFGELKGFQKKQIYILTGTIDGGKTTFVKNLIAFLESKAIGVGGIYAEKIFQQDVFEGYDLVHISTLEKVPFMKLKNADSENTFGRFTYNEASINTGKDWLLPKNFENKTVVVIDEIGKWELEQKGWFDSLQLLLKTTDLTIILAVREPFVEDVKNHFGIPFAKVWDVQATSIDFLGNQIIGKQK